jgi:hypothetical protein
MDTEQGPTEAPPTENNTEQKDAEMKEESKNEKKVSRWLAHCSVNKFLVHCGIKKFFIVIFVSITVLLPFKVLNTYLVFVSCSNVNFSQVYGEYVLTNCTKRQLSSNKPDRLRGRGVRVDDF